jgi:hypothetical protein
MSRSGLADARLAGEQDNLPLTRLRFSPATQQELVLFLAPDQRGQPAGVQRLKAAFLRTLRHSHVGGCRSRNPFKLLQAEVSEFKQVA